MKGGSTFMEDYTYHLDPANEGVLGAHMLEICPSIAAKKPRLEVHPLGIGGKDAPARLIFESATGDAAFKELFEGLCNVNRYGKPFQNYRKHTGSN